MARVTPITIPSGVQVSINEQHVSVKGSKGTLEHNVHPLVEVQQQEDTLVFKARAEQMGAVAQTGTARAVLRNLKIGRAHV